MPRIFDNEDIKPQQRITYLTTQRWQVPIFPAS